jgi:hypothetical protein
MPHSAAHHRYRAEADYALRRLKHYREQGDGERADSWHRAWSLAEEAAAAELSEQGGGSRLLRWKVQLPLRPLPDDVPPLAEASLAPAVDTGATAPDPVHNVRSRYVTIERALQEGGPNPLPQEITEGGWWGHLRDYRAHGSAGCALLQAARTALKALGEELPDRPPTGDAGPDPLPGLLERHARIERALEAGGPNPFPGELDEAEWQNHLTAFQAGGPYDCELLQDVEAAIEAIVEFRPEYHEPEAEPDPGSEGLHWSVLPECVRIYRESLPDLTEDELRADLETCLHAGRNDTAALIEEELRQRERETPPPAPTPEPDQTEPGDVPAKSSPVPPAPDAASAPHAGGKGEPAPVDRVSETGTGPERPRYTTAPAWIDTAGRTRTWSLIDPEGRKMADITTKRDAEKLAEVFNRIMQGELVTRSW